jgi:hypothetical protein
LSGVTLTTASPVTVIFGISSANNGCCIKTDMSIIKKMQLRKKISS